MLPKHKVSFSYYNVLQKLEEEGAGRKTDLHGWTGTVKRIFPAKTVAATSTTNTGGPKVSVDASGEIDCDNAPITADEAIAAIASYGATRKVRDISTRARWSPD